MKLLYIAPISEGESHSSGYASASDGMLSVFRKMTHDGLIESFHSISNIREDFTIPIERYDICIVNTNISLLYNNHSLLRKYREIKRLCKKMYFSFVWEAMPYPKEFSTFFKSDLVDGILCPSRFCAYILDDIDKPKFYYPHYIDTTIFKKIDIELKLKEKEFTVLSLGQNTNRKGFIEGITAFVQELGNKEDCRMIIKSNTIHQQEESITNKISRISLANGLSKAKIYCIDNKNLDADEIIKLYHSASVVLLPSKGEGFGLNLPEAMSCGLPCIYTNWSAWTEKFYNTNSNSPIHFICDSVRNMHDYGFSPDSMWAQPLVYSIKQKLREKYNQWKNNKLSYYTNSLKDNRKIIKDNFEYEAIKNTIIDIFKNTTIKI